MSLTGQIIKRFYDTDKRLLTTYVDKNEITLSVIGDDTDKHPAILKGLLNKPEDSTLIKQWTNHASQPQATQYSKDATYLIQGQQATSFGNYYLETVVYQDAYNNIHPLSLILHLDSQALPHDCEQQHWLTECLANPAFQRFPHKILIQQDAVLFSPESKQHDAVTINTHNKTWYQQFTDYLHYFITSNSQYSYQRLIDTTRPFIGNHYRQVGLALQNCNLSLDQWIVLANSNTKAIIDNYGDPHCPKVQALFGSPNQPNLNAMIPGLQATPSGVGYGRLTLLSDGSVKLSYYDCSNSLPESPYEQLTRQYNTHGQLISQWPAYPQQTPELIDPNIDYEHISQLLLAFIQTQTTDWRFLAWSIIITTCGEYDLNRHYIATPLFHRLLQTTQQNHAELSTSLLNEVLAGINEFFKAYTDHTFQGGYTAFFSQLAFWHQALNKLIELLNTSPTANPAQINNNPSVYNAMQHWLSNYTQHAHTPINPNALGNTGNQSADQVSLTNEFNSPTGPNIQSYTATTTPSALTNKTLDEFVNNTQALRLVLIKAIENALQERSGFYWHNAVVFMEHYNEFAQAFILTALINQNPVEGLSAILQSQPYNWLSCQLLAELIYYTMYPDEDHNVEPIFKSSLKANLNLEKSYQHWGRLLTQLAINKPTSWHHYLQPLACYKLVRQPLIRDQILKWLNWDYLGWQQSLITNHINHLSKITDLQSHWQFPLINCFKSSHDPTNISIYQAFFAQLVNLFDTNSTPSQLAATELQLKQYLTNCKPHQRNPYWYQALQHFGEWLLTYNEPNDLTNKWRLLQENWPTLWRPSATQNHNDPVISVSEAEDFSCQSPASKRHQSNQYDIEMTPLSERKSSPSRQ